MALNRRNFLKLATAGCFSIVGYGAGVRGTAHAAARIATLVVPAPPGTRTDVAGRLLAAALQRDLQTDISVLNVAVPGEAYEYLASAPADGAVIGLVAADLAVMHWRGVTAVGPESVRPLAQINEDPAGIHVALGAQWQSARELVASLRANEKPMKASGAGRLAIWHLSAQRWAMASGAGPSALSWDAASGPAEAAAGLATGANDIVVCSVPEIRSTASRRKVKTLAVMANRRSPRYPDIATLGEAGLTFRAGLWRGVAGPRGLSPALAEEMTAALRRAYASEGFRRDMSRRGFGLTWADAAPFAQFMAREDQAMSAAMKAIG